MASQTPKNPAPRPAKTTPKETRRGVKNPWIFAMLIVVLVIITIAFIAFPMSGSMAGGFGGNELEFGSYAGKPILKAPSSYFQLQLQMINDQFKQQASLAGMDQAFLNYQIFRTAFERTVINYGILDEVDRAGGVVTENHLDNLVRDSAAFQENGKFSLARFRAAGLARQIEVRENIRTELLAAQYSDMLDRLKPSSKEVAFIKDMAKDTRSIEYAAFKLSDFPDEEVLTWARANSQLFRRLKLSRITIGTNESDASKLRKQIESKTVTFEDAAKAHSKDAWADKGGDQGLRFFHDLGTDLSKKEEAEKVAALKSGELSPIFKTPTGTWTFYRANEAIVATDFSDPTVMKDARDYMERNERGKVEDWSVNRARNFADSKPRDFAAAAKKAGASTNSAGPFPINYGGITISIYGQTVPLLKPVASAQGEELSSAGSNEKFLTQVFSVAPGSLTDPLIVGEYVIVAKVKEAISAPDETSGIEFYYPEMYRQKILIENRDVFMNSPRLKDDFSKVYFQYYAPQPSPSAGGQS